MENSLAGSQSLFVLELVSAGYFGDQIGPSFRAEGRAMLDAVLEDLRRIPGLRVDTPLLEAADGMRGLLLDSVARHGADSSLIIAPEFDGLLEKLSAAATNAGGRSLNCDPEALGLCRDKWRLFRHFAAHDVATIPSRLLPLDELPAQFPCVVKPRDGAGSWLVRTVANCPAWRATADEFTAAGLTACLCQPLIPGGSYSVGAIFSSEGGCEILPVAEQHLSDDGEHRYLGGRIPARLPIEIQCAIRQLAERSLATMSGLRGYVGCDVIVPLDRAHHPLLVEINPRFTTSYIGYRQLCRDNLMERLLCSGSMNRPLQWRSGEVTFGPQGRCTEPADADRQGPPADVMDVMNEAPTRNRSRGKTAAG